VLRYLAVDRRADFIRQTKHLTGLIRHDSKDALSRIELLLSKLEEGESLKAVDIAAKLTEARLEMYEVLRGTERIEEFCERESESQRS
jgi:hypothetical protein